MGKSTKRLGFSFSSGSSLWRPASSARLCSETSAVLVDTATSSEDVDATLSSDAGSGETGLVSRALPLASVGVLDMTRLVSSRKVGCTEMVMVAGGGGEAWTLMEIELC